MAEIPHNERTYPYNIMEPTDVEVDGDIYTIYRAKFSSLHDLYKYLKSNPKINRKVFYRLHSEDGSRDFAGVPYEEALEELTGPPRGEFGNFLRLSGALEDDAMGYVQEYVTVKSPGGGNIDVPSYVSGSPLCFTITRSVYKPKFITVNIALSYYWGTTKEQVLNRAIIIAALVNAFENAGYVVEVNAFEVSREGNEIIDIDVNIKGDTETFNKASLYKSLCYVEFLRRLLFRVLETLSVERDWESGYGQTCTEEFVRKLRGFDDSDIFFDQPKAMGIKGFEEIEYDFEPVLEHLNLRDIIDVDKVVKDFNDEVKTLRKTIR